MRRYIDETNGIWNLEMASRHHSYDPVLAGAIKYLYKNPKRVADLGCGTGRYCKILESFDWIVDGYEGTENIMELGIYDNIFHIDLSKPLLPIKYNYDLVMCLEVGEHIPKDREDTFIDNVAQFVTKDLVLSWAIPGQGGKGHFNERSNKYVIKKFRERGLYVKKRWSKVLRYYSTLRWFKNTIIVMERK